MNQGMILRIDTLGGQCPVQAEGRNPGIFEAKGPGFRCAASGLLAIPLPR